MKRWIFTHHKCASGWSHALFDAIAHRLGGELSYHNTFPHGQIVTMHELTEDLARGNAVGMVYDSNARYSCIESLETLGDEFRAVHILRDPRDLLVSAYYSHRNVHPTGKWPALIAQRERLQQLDLESGLLDEIAFAGFALDAIASWNYVHRSIHTVRYETLFAHPEREIPLMMRWLKLPVPASDLAGILEALSFERLAGGRSRGQADNNHHFRKGVPGDWREHFTPRVKDAFKERYGTALVASGYESGLDW